MRASDLIEQNTIERGNVNCTWLHHGTMEEARGSARTLANKYRTPIHIMGGRTCHDLATPAALSRCKGNSVEVVYQTGDV